MNTNSSDQFPHDRDHVRLLQHAHADHIESMYRALAALEGNPESVVIRSIAATRTFIAAGQRLENRAIFLGDETPEQIDAVLQHFVDHRANLVIEVNPANYYVNPPVTWERRLLNHLLSRGCRIDGFRCVWCRTRPLDADERSEDARIEPFTRQQIDQYIPLARKLKPKDEWDAQRRATSFAPGWTQYIGFDLDEPAAMGTLFVTPESGYLAWWYTDPARRGRGLQRAGILRRLRDGFDAGCKRIFTVTDFNFTSPRNLQRCGFTLAYNYLLVRRDPLPL